MAPSTESPPSGGGPAKIAIKGFSLSSKSSKLAPFAPKQKPSPASSLGKRTRAALTSHDSDSEDERPVRHEEVTGFDIGAGGALRKQERQKEGPLIIPRMKNRDWREEIRQGRKGKDLLPPEVRAQREGQGADVVVPGVDEEVKWGLTVTKKEAKEEVAADGNSGEPSTEVTSITEVVVEAPAEKTVDQEAIEALMGIKTEKKGPALVIGPAVAVERTSPPLTEEDAYRRAIRAAPDVSTLEDYERVPVEEFGAALLRGMGWKENSKVKRPKEVKRRQNLLGLGATELKGAEELGAWVQKSDPKRLASGSGKLERRPRANEYREKEERRREERDHRYGGSHRRDRNRNDYRDRDRDRRR